MSQLIMLWPFLILSFAFAVISGLVVFSHGRLFNTLAGQAIQNLMSLMCIGFIGWAFWHHGWGIGVIETFVVFGGSNVGLTTLERSRNIQ